MRFIARMCGDRYFQIFEDLLLALDTLQYCEPGNEGKFSGDILNEYILNKLSLI